MFLVSLYYYSLFLLLCFSSPCDFGLPIFSFFLFVPDEVLPHFDLDSVRVSLHRVMRVEEEPHFILSGLVSPCYFRRFVRDCFNFEAKVGSIDLHEKSYHCYSFFLLLVSVTKEIVTVVA